MSCSRCAVQATPALAETGLAEAEVLGAFHASSSPPRCMSCNGRWVYAEGDVCSRCQEQGVTRAYLQAPATCQRTINRDTYDPEPVLPVTIRPPHQMRASTLWANIQAGSPIQLMGRGASLCQGVLVNWGSKTNSIRTMGEVLINDPQQVARVSDKAQVMRLLGELAPKTVFSAEQAHTLNNPIPLNEKGQVTQHSPVMYQEKLTIERGYRVNLLNGRLTSAHSLQLDEQTNRGTVTNEPDPAVEEEIPDEALQRVAQAQRWVGIDFAGFDLVQANGRWFITNVYSAPALTKRGLIGLYNSIQAFLKETQ